MWQSLDLNPDVWLQSPPCSWVHLISWTPKPRPSLGKTLGICELTADLDGDLLRPLIQYYLPAPDSPLCPTPVTQMEGDHVGTQSMLSGMFPWAPRAWLSGQAPPTHTSTLS